MKKQISFIILCLLMFTNFSKSEPNYLLLGKGGKSPKDYGYSINVEELENRSKLTIMLTPKAKQAFQRSWVCFYDSDNNYVSSYNMPVTELDDRKGQMTMFFNFNKAQDPWANIMVMSHVPKREGMPDDYAGFNIPFGEIPEGMFVKACPAPPPDAKSEFLYPSWLIDDVSDKQWPSPMTHSEFQEPDIPIEAFELAGRALAHAARIVGLGGHVCSLVIRAVDGKIDLLYTRVDCSPSEYDLSSDIWRYGRGAETGSFDWAVLTTEAALKVGDSQKNALVLKIYGKKFNTDNRIVQFFRPGEDKDTFRLLGNPILITKKGMFFRIDREPQWLKDVMTGVHRESRLSELWDRWSEYLTR